MTKQQRQQEIFKNFSNGDELISVSNSKWKVQRNNNDNVYFMVYKDFEREWQNKLIFEITNDVRTRFIMKWKVWEINYQKEDKTWSKAYVIVLNRNNQWDNEIINDWMSIAQGYEDVKLINKETININKW